MFYMVVSGVYVFWKLFVEPKKSVVYEKDSSSITC